MTQGRKSPLRFGGAGAALLAVLAVACGGSAVNERNRDGTGGSQTATPAASASSPAPTASPPSPPSVLPTESLAWTWHDCGQITGTAGRAIASLALSADGAFLATDDGGTTTAWSVAATFSDSKSLWSAGGEGADNVDVSADGSRVSLGGDVREVLDARDAQVIGPVDSGPPAGLSISTCFSTEFRFSPDGKLLAGKHYGTTVDVFETVGFKKVAELETYGCGQGIAFSADGSSIHTPEASFDTQTFAAIHPPSASGQAAPDPLSSPIVTILLRGSETLVTTCDASPGCTTVVEGYELHGGRHPALSAEGDWIVSAGQLLHIPSQTQRELDADVTEALFAPNGDVIAGHSDGSLQRYCRE